MATDYSAEKAHLLQIINSGISSVSADGLSTTYDIDAARKRLAELEQLEANGKKRNRVVSLRLGGCW